MAKIISENGKEIKVDDGERIRPACEKLGVPFGCRNGLCGSCMIEILEGEDNLSELTEEEIDMSMDRKTRLACQCKIKEGTVKIRF